MADKELAKRDMYGHTIHRLEGTEFGVSIAYDGDGKPDFTVFHESDNFRQSLFSIGYSKEKYGVGLMWQHNCFEKRIAEVFGE